MLSLTTVFFMRSQPEGHIVYSITTHATSNGWDVVSGCLLDFRQNKSTSTSMASKLSIVLYWYNQSAAFRQIVLLYSKQACDQKL